MLVKIRDHSFKYHKFSRYVRNSKKSMIQQHPKVHNFKK